MIIVNPQKPVSLKELSKMAEKMFGNLVKAVVDVKKEIMVIDGELHSDEEALLLRGGSRQEDVWGTNLYPDLPLEEWIEFDSMINVRPSLGNLSRNIEDPKIREKIIKIVNRLIKR